MEAWDISDLRTDLASSAVDDELSEVEVKNLYNRISNIEQQIEHITKKLDKKWYEPFVSLISVTTFTTLVVCILSVGEYKKTVDDLNKSFDKADSKLVSLELGQSRVETKLEDVSKRFDLRLENIEKKIDKVDLRLDNNTVSKSDFDNYHREILKALRK